MRMQVPDVLRTVDFLTTTLVQSSKSRAVDRVASNVNPEITTSETPFARSRPSDQATTGLERTSSDGHRYIFRAARSTAHVPGAFNSLNELKTKYSRPVRGGVEQQLVGIGNVLDIQQLDL